MINHRCNSSGYTTYSLATNQIDPFHKNRTNDTLQGKISASSAVIFQKVARRNIQNNSSRMRQKPVSDPELLQYNAAIAKHARNNDEQSALRVFKAIPDHIPPDIFTYASLIRLYTRINRAGAAVKLFDEMLSKNIEANFSVYSCLLCACARQSYPKRAFYIFNHMIKNEYMPDLTTLNHILTLYMRMQDIPKAIELHQLLIQKEVQLDVNICTSLINVYAQTDTPLRGFSILDYMSNNNIHPNKSTYKSLIKASIQGRNYQKTCFAIKRLRESFNCDQYTYHNLIHLSVKTKSYYTTLQLYCCMCLDNITPNRKSCNDLIRVFILINDHTSLKTILNQMHAENITLTQLQYNKLLDLSIQQDKHLIAYLIFDHMITENKKPNDSSYGNFLELSIQEKEHQTAVITLGLMFIKNIKPNGSTYNKLFALCIQKNDILNALAIFDQLIQEKVKINWNLYNKLVSKMCLISDTQLDGIWNLKPPLERKIYQENNQKMLQVEKHVECLIRTLQQSQAN